MIFLTGANGTLGSYVFSDFQIDFRSLIASNILGFQSNSLADSTLIHLAGISNPNIVEANRENSYFVNVTSTLALFERFAKAGGRRFIFASSGHIYGYSGGENFATEGDPILPKSEYAKQKAQTETMLADLASKYDVELLILRIFSVFGNGMRHNYLAGMIEKSLSENRSFPLIFNSDDVRDFTKPSKVGAYLNKSVTIDMEQIQIVNICSGVARSIREIITDEYPEFPSPKFKHGNSDMPWLVGNPLQMRRLFHEI